MGRRKGVWIPIETAKYYERLDRVINKSKVSMTWEQFCRAYPQDARWFHHGELFDAIEDYEAGGR